ncbi:MAG: hypothetical protein U0P30_05785 [Vicinamibacterales bacterium]
MRELDVEPAVGMGASIAATAPLGAGAHTALDRAPSSCSGLRCGRPQACPDAGASTVDVARRPRRHDLDRAGREIGRRRWTVSFRGRAAGLESALAGLGTLYSAERLHVVRIAVKQLRGVLEVAGELRTRATAADRRRCAPPRIHGAGA